MEHAQHLQHRQLLQRQQQEHEAHFRSYGYPQVEAPVPYIPELALQDQSGMRQGYNYIQRQQEQQLLQQQQQQQQRNSVSHHQMTQFMPQYVPPANNSYALQTQYDPMRAQLPVKLNTQVPQPIPTDKTTWDDHKKNDNASITSTDSGKGKFIGFSSGLPLLADLLKSTSLPSATPWPHLVNDPFLNEMGDMRPIASMPIPCRKSVSTMFDLYDEIVSPIFPIFTKTELAKMLDSIFLNGNIARRDIDEPTLNSFSLILGQVLGIISRQEPALTEMSNSCVRFTRSGLSEIFMNPSLKGIKCMLSILAINHAKELPDPVWFTNGSATHMCIDLNLHRARPPLPADASLEERELEEERRRVFWTSYSIDRGLSLAFGRPLMYTENCISCPLPEHVSPQVLSRFKIRRLQGRVIKSHQLVDNPTVDSFPTLEEEGFMQSLADWRETSSGSPEEQVQDGNTELLILRRGIYVKNPPAMTRSLTVVQQNLQLYKTEGVQLAIVEGLLVVHNLFVNCITLLYIYRFGRGHDMTCSRMKEIVQEMRPLFYELSRRWTTAIESMQLVDAILQRVCE